MNFAELLWGTVIHRPYVYGFFLCYLIFSGFQMGAGRTGVYLVFAYAVALLSELGSTRFGFPFGYYTYLDGMRTRELWISNVPFWDSLSFVFLSYFSWNLAAAVLARGEPESTRKLLGSSRCPAVFLLSGILMMLLDIVIDPLTLRGDRWFLGKIYYYPQGGSYFGVTLANFGGWFLLGAFIPWVFVKFLSRSAPGRAVSGRFFLGVFGVYAGVLLFNLGITAWIGEWSLFTASLLVTCATLGLSARALRANTGKCSGIQRSPRSQ